MSISAQFFELTNIAVVFPNIWVYVAPTFIIKQGITLDDMKNLNADFELFGVQNMEGLTSLSKRIQPLVNRIKFIYEKQKKIYEDNLSYQYAYHQQSQFQQPIYYDQQQAYYANNYGYTQQPGYPQQSGHHQQGYPAQGGYYPQQGYGQQPSYPMYNQNNQQAYNQSYGQHQYGHPQQQQQFNQYAQQYQYAQQQETTQEVTSYGGEQGYEPQPTQYQHRTNYRNNYHQNNHHNNHHHYQNQNQNQKYVAKGSHPAEDSVTVPEARVEVTTPVEPVPVKVEVVEEKKPEPPKPEKKKMSIEEIKQLIAGANDKEALKKSVDPTLVKQVEQVNNWKKIVDKIDIIAPAQGDKGGKPYNNKKEFQRGKQEGGDKGDFVKGSRYNSKPAPPPQATQFEIIVGKNQNVDTALFKKELSKRADNFAEKKAKEQETLDKVQKAKRDIQYDLNKVAPENVKDVFNEMQKFATEEQDVCLALVQSIIQKSWEQPKYAACYAKLSSYFAKIDPNKFKFGETKKDKKSNPFKHILVEKVQHSFDKKQKKEATNLKQEEIDKFAKETKNLLIGNVKFIAELIKIKLIPKGIIKYCISVLLKDFFDGYYNFHKNDLKELNFYEYNFEALIEFLENLGEKFESIDGEKPEKAEKGKKGEEQEKQEEPTGQSNKTSNYNEVQEKVSQYCKFKESSASLTQIEGLDNLKADEIFKLFAVIAKEALPNVKDGSRLRALLQNLQERRVQGWKKHNVESEGPKKLKDLNKDEAQISPQEKRKAELALLDDRMAKFLKKWAQSDHKDKTIFGELDSLAQKFQPEDVIGAFLKFVADDKKDFLPKRMEVFDILLDKHFKKLSLKKAWDLHFANIAMLVSEFPFCAAVLAKLVITYKEKYGGANLADYFIVFDQDEQMDEYYFMNEVFQKLYHYSQDEGVKSKITPIPAAKLKHLL